MVQNSRRLFADDDVACARSFVRKYALARLAPQLRIHIVVTRLFGRGGVIEEARSGWVTAKTGQAAKQDRIAAASPFHFLLLSERNSMDRDALVYKAKLAEQAERFDEMVTDMKEVAR